MKPKRLSDVDISGKKALSCYENLLQKRLKRFGYQVSKRKTIRLGPQHIELKKCPVDKGFRITEIASDKIIAGANYDVPIEEVEAFWLEKYNAWVVERQKVRDERRRAELTAQKRPKTITIDGWTLTNDQRAIDALKAHTTQHGDFDADGHGAGGDIWDVVYRAYRPCCCPQFSRVWPVDGDLHNLTDMNLRSDVEETDLPEGEAPVTKQRRIWHNQHRIFIKLFSHNDLFFTTYSPEMFHLLCNTKELKSWYIQIQVRNTKIVKRLHCRIDGKVTAFSEIIALYDAGKIDMNNITGSILTGKQWLRDNNLQIDHLRNNTKNACPHSIAIMPAGKNIRKSDLVMEICAPYFFIAARIGNSFRVLLGKFGAADEFSRYIICAGVDEFVDCLKRFVEVAKASGDMRPIPKDPVNTTCISQMLQDDGEEYHEGQYNPIEGLLKAAEDTFTPWNGNVSLLHPIGE